MIPLLLFILILLTSPSLYLSVLTYNFTCVNLLFFQVIQPTKTWHVANGQLRINYSLRTPNLSSWNAQFKIRLLPWNVKPIILECSTLSRVSSSRETLIHVAMQNAQLFQQNVCFIAMTLKCKHFSSHRLPLKHHLLQI